MFLKDSRVDVNKENQYNDTAFMLAASNGHVEVVQMFLKDSRVDVNKKSHYGDTALMLAASNAYVEIVQMLLKDDRVDVKIAQKSDIINIISELTHVEEEQKNLLIKLVEDKAEQKAQDYSKMSKESLAKILPSAAADGKFKAVKEIVHLLKKKSTSK
jgi:ankyrin repeat protein